MRRYRVAYRFVQPTSPPLNSYCSNGHIAGRWLPPRNATAFIKGPILEPAGMSHGREVSKGLLSGPSSRPHNAGVPWDLAMYGCRGRNLKPAWWPRPSVLVCFRLRVAQGHAAVQRLDVAAAAMPQPCLRHVELQTAAGLVAQSPQHAADFWARARQEPAAASAGGRLPRAVLNTSPVPPPLRTVGGWAAELARTLPTAFTPAWTPDAAPG
jgi:hypothetical protein